MRKTTPTDRRLHLMFSAIRQMVEDHFNKEQEQRKYVVYEIALTSTANYPKQLSKDLKPYSATSIHAKFIAKIVDASLPSPMSISCILSMHGSTFFIDNIYFTKDGKPVEGFTREVEP